MTTFNPVEKITTREALRFIAGDSLMSKILKSVLGRNKGLRQSALLTLSGNATDGDQFSVGNRTFEVVQVNTTTGVNTAADTVTGFSANTTDPTTQTITAHGLVVGDILACQSEVVTVRGVTDANTVVLNRAQYGTSAASHNNQTINKINPARAVGSLGRAPESRGRYALPVLGTLTNTTVGPLYVAAINALSTATGNLLKAVSGATNGLVWLTRPFAKGNLVNTESITNGTITDFSSGADDASGTKTEIPYVVTAADVSASGVTLFLDATPVAARVTFLDASAGAVDTTSTVTSVAVTGTKLVVTEGTTQWVAGDILLIEAWF